MNRWTEEQLKAINDEGKNIIVSAGAGSGKTAVLTERVLRKIKQGININELLILTFTSSAAAEMKNRIRKKILNENLNNQLDLLDQAFITTFDSYALFIVKKYSYILNISNDISIVESSVIDIKKKEILDSICEYYYGLNDEEFNKLITDFCTKDDDIIKEGILSIYKKLSIKYDFKKYIEDYINNYFNNDYIDKKIEEYINLLKDKIEDLKPIIKTITDIEDIEYVNKLYKVIDPLLKSNNYDEIKLNSSITLPSMKKESEAYGYKELLSSNIKEINKLCIYDNKKEIKESIENTKQNTNTICRILLEFNDKLNQYKENNNLYEFSDIASLAIKIVSDNDDIREEIKNSFNEILLDEYQDTNDLQETFISLISNNNVYSVGDIKQSIYRFRNANPEIFKNKYDKYKDNIFGEKIDLNKNFRSREEVLRDINLLFNLIMKDEIGGANYMLEHQLSYGNTTYSSSGKTNQDYNLSTYTYENENYRNEEIEAFIIAYDIKNKVDNNYKVFDKDTLVLRNISYDDIVILMDRKKDFDLYKKIFEYVGIPLTLNKEENINTGYDLSLIKNILKLIIKVNKNTFDNEFKHCFISIERSFLIEDSDSQIFDYITNNTYKDSYLYSLIENIDINDLSIKDLIEIIIEKFDIYNKLPKVGNICESLIRLEYILNLSGTLENMYSIEEFIDYLDNVEKQKLDIKYSINMDTPNSVKMMTIFKSKGLEFNVCYFPGLYNEFNKQEFKEKFFYSEDYGIIIPYYKEGIRETFYKILFKDKYTKDEVSEKIRLLYVALTRAKEKIILLKPNKCKIKTNILDCKSFLDMINLSEDLIDREKLVDLDKINISKDYNLVKDINYKSMINISDITIKENTLKFEPLILENKKYSKDASIINKEIKEKMNFGIEIHKELENIDFKNPNTDLVDNKFIKNKIDKFLQLNIFNNIINAYKEYEFYYEKNTLNHGIIDLLLEYESEYKIIDYKLKNIDDENYIKQLNGYKNYIENIGNKKVSIYLYSFIDEKLEEIKN